jgi:hypothetical protein
MSGARAIRAVPVTGAAAHGACLVCTVLRHHQTRLVEVTGVPKASHLCNHHAWSLARSAPSQLASEIYAQVLSERRKGAGSGERICTFCIELRREESARLNELVEQMNIDSFVAWMRRSGTLCLWHADRLTRRMPAKMRSVVDEILARTADELQADLGKCAAEARLGRHSGGGVLGRVAEFLVCQRGIPREETPC